MKLYVDDRRTAPPGWALARTVDEALALLSAGGVEEVSLDYFIGDGEDNFEDVARFIAVMPAGRRPRRVHLHTASDAAAARMTGLLRGCVEELLR